MFADFHAPFTGVSYVNVNLTSHSSMGILNRRTFVRNGSLFLLGSSVNLAQAAPLLADEPEQNNQKLRIGLITDMHYADKAPAGTRFYRESLTKLQEAANQFQKDSPDFTVELGDFIDAADSISTERKYVQRINKVFAKLPGTKHYVLGNHCVHTLTKEEFLGAVGQQKSFYSFDAGGFHFVILDACFRADGKPYGRKNFTWTDTNIPNQQIEWIQADLKATPFKTIVFCHQRLDVSANHSVKNAAAVRKVLQASGKVLAVFQGHSHENSHQEISGIHYCVLSAMVEGSGAENNGYSILDILDNEVIRLTGFRKQANHTWS